MFKKRGLAIWMILVMMFSCIPVQVFAAGASISNARVTDITETNAMFRAVLNNATGIQPSEVGIYFGESQNNMNRAARDTYVYNQATLDFWYSANGDMGITLEPATTYYYCFYAIINGETIWSATRSMKTAGAPKPEASIGNEEVTDKTQTDGTFRGVLYNPTRIQPSEVGCYIGTSSSNMRLLGKDTYVYNQAELDIWYNANDEGMTLEPDTKYYFKFYAIIDGRKIEGKTRSTTTKPAEVVKEEHIHKWISSTKYDHPHSSIRTCNECGVSEIVKKINYMKNCEICNPPKVETVKKSTFKNGIYEISNNASGKFLNAYGSSSGWKVVTIANDNSIEQKFEIKSSGNGNYTIKTRGYNGRYLYLSGTNLVTGKTGEFCFVSRGNGEYSISPANDTSKALTQTSTAVYGGDHIVTLQEYVGAKNQLWTLGIKGDISSGAAQAPEVKPPITPAEKKASFSNVSASNITKTGAVLNAVLNNPTGIKPTEVGCYIGESEAGMKLGAKDTNVFNRTSLEVWYDINQHMGKTLAADKTYYYQFYAVINGVNIESPINSFRTRTVETIQNSSFKGVTANSVTDTNAVLGAILQNPTGLFPSEVGCMLGTRADNLTVVGKDVNCFNWKELDVWYNLNSDCKKVLSPGTNYYYRFYAVINGKRVISPIKSFKTLSVGTKEGTNGQQNQYEGNEIKNNKSTFDILFTDGVKQAGKVLFDVLPTGAIYECQKDLVNQDYIGFMEIVTEEFIGDISGMLGGAANSVYGNISTLVLCAPYYIEFGDVLGKYVIAEQELHEANHKKNQEYFQTVAKEATAAYLLGMKHRGTSVPAPTEVIKETQKNLDAFADVRCSWLDELQKPWYMYFCSDLKKEYKELKSDIQKIKKQTDLMAIYKEARYGG